MKRTSVVNKNGKIDYLALQKILDVEEAQQRRHSRDWLIRQFKKLGFLVNNLSMGGEK